MKKKKTTKDFGYILCIFTALFILALLLTTVKELAPVTAARLTDCNARIDAYEGDLEVAKASGASEEDITYLTNQINKYKARADMLQHRDVYYYVSMGFLLVLAMFGSVIQFVSTASFSQNGQKTYKYYPFFSAPLCAVCILLAIGVTYRAIFGVTLTDLVMLVGAVGVGAVVFFVYRHAPLIIARLSHTRLGNNKKVSVADVLFFLPVVGILGLLAANLLFGVTINGAKLWINVMGIQLQPSEFIKVLLVVLLASAYGKLWKAVVAVATGGITILVMLFLHDMGSAIVVFAMLILMLFLLLDNKITFSLLFDHKKLLTIIMILSVLAFFFALTLFPYALERFSNLGTAMEKDGQQAEILRALIFGGVGGLGIENSSYLINIYAIDCDLALAGLTAVFGYGMLLITMLCYAIIIIIPIRKIAVHREYYFATAQVSIALFVQVLFNALGAVDVLPFTGIVAPFISSGGSALVGFCAMAGLVLATLHPVVKLKQREV